MVIESEDDEDTPVAADEDVQMAVDSSDIPPTNSDSVPLP